MSLHVSISNRKARNCNKMRGILKYRQARVQSLVGKSQELQRGTAGPQIFLTCLFTNHQRLNSLNKTWEAEELLISEAALPCKLQSIPHRCQEVTHLVLWTESTRGKDTELPNNLSAASEKYHCILSIRKSTREKMAALYANDSIKEVWDYLNTLRDGWAHWSHPRGAPSITKMRLVTGGFLCLSHAKHISVADHHKVHWV